MGLVRWDDAGKAILGLIGNGVGAFAGGVLIAAPDPSMLSKPVGYAIAAKSVYGWGANWYNLTRALSDDGSYDIKSSYASLPRAIATQVDPCNENLLRIADAAELGLDLVSMKVAIGNVPFGSSGYLKSPIGYPPLNSSSILTRPGYYGDFVGSNARALTTTMGVFQAGQYGADALSDYRNSNGVCGCQ